MIDLETISTQANARIIAIGAVKFAQDKGVYDKFYQAVIAPEFEPLMQSHVDDLGFHISNETLGWWARQSIEARGVFTDPNAVTINAALKAFSSWATNDCDMEEVRMWGNGASFDNPILANAYRLCNMEQPWMFWNDRCYRTMKAEHPLVQFTRTGTHHNALDDAECQADHLLKMGVLPKMLYDMD